MRVHDPFQFAVLPAMLTSGVADFLFRFCDHVDGVGSAANCTLVFTLFRDTMAYNQGHQPAQLVGRFDSMQIPDSPTHSVRVDLAPGQYLWVATAVSRAFHRDSDYPMPGVFLNCGALGVRRVTGE